MVDAGPTSSAPRGYEQASITVTSNLPFGRRGETFSDDVVAATMIDRLVHHAEVFTLSGDSYRTRARRELLVKDRAQSDGAGPDDGAMFEGFVDEAIPLGPVTLQVRHALDAGCDWLGGR